MLLACIGVALVVVVTYLYLKFYLKPKQACKRYARMLKDMGYRVYELPFRPLGATLYQLYNEYGKQKGDPCYPNKQIFKDYDVIVSNLVTYPSLIFANMKLGKQILSPDKIMTAPKIQVSMKLLNHAIGDGLAFIEGENWKDRRKILSKAFSFELLKDMAPLISKICDQNYNKLAESSNSNGEISAELFKIGNRLFALVVLTGFLGLDNVFEYSGEEELQETALHIVEEAATLSRDPWVIFLGMWFYKLGLKKQYRALQNRLKSFRGFISKKINAFRQEFNLMTVEQRQKSKNIVQLMLHYSNEDGKELKDQQILDQILTFVVAGADSTAAVYSVILLAIFENREVEEKLRKTIEIHFKTEEDFNYQNLKNMEYLDWVQLEAMRMYGPVDAVMDRVASTDIHIADIPIHKDTAISYTLKASYSNNDIFQEADKFKPERWENPNPDLFNLVSMHFSGGPRSCIGKNLALIELKISVIKFLQRFKDFKETNKREFIWTIMYHIKSTASTFRTTK